MKNVRQEMWPEEFYGNTDRYLKEECTKKKYDQKNWQPMEKSS